MAVFKFNLQGVLRQRELVEDVRQRELAAVQARYATMEAQLKAMDEEVRAASDDLRQNRLIGRVDLNFLAAHRRFTLAMQRRALELATQMAPVKQAVDAARAALVEAAKQRKIMEKLREKRQADWSADQARRETAATDEIAQQLGVRLIRAAVAAGEAEQVIAASESLRSADSAWQDTP
jgi:flagellar FliJ protein